MQNINSDLIRGNIDTIILGCTHFGLYSKELLNVFPNAKLVGCGGPTADELFAVLNKNENLNQTKKIGEIEINSTSDPDFMQEKIAWFKHGYKGVNLIKL